MSKEVLNGSPAVNNNEQEDEINLIELAYKLWSKRKFIMLVAGIAFFIGLLVAIFSAKEYTARILVVPQSKSAGAGNVGALAALAGVNISSGGGEVISPAMYSQILSSTPYQMEMIENEFNFPDIDNKVSLITYLGEVKQPTLGESIKKYTIGLPRIVLGWFKSEENKLTHTAEDSLLFLSDEQSVACGYLNEVLKIEVKDEYVELSCVTDDAKLSAQIVDAAYKLLQDYIIQYKVEQATRHFNFISNRLDEKQNVFEEKQNELAEFRDKNKNMSTNVAIAKLEQLQSEYSLAYSVYSELAQQYEAALIKVKEDTPVLTVIEPVQIPRNPSAPNRSLIIVIFVFLGGFIGVGIVLAREFLETIKGEWGEYAERSSDEDI